MRSWIPITLVALASFTTRALPGQTAIVDADSHLCLDVSSTGVAETECVTKAMHQFTIFEQADGYALVGSAGRCLTGADGRLTAVSCDGARPEQMFKPVAQAGGGYALLNRQSGLCLSSVGSAGGQASLADCEAKSVTAFQMPGWAPPKPSGRPPRQQKNAEPLPGGGYVISGLNIQGDYTLYSPKFDGATLTNSTITGALKIDGVHHLRVQGNHLNAIWFRGQQATDGVTIESNDIGGAAGDCIHIHDGGAYPTHVLIENNDIHDCGSKYPASGLYHAIYDQVPDVVIRQNHIWNAKSALSIRSSGVIDGNTIERLTNGGAIEYFSDHGAPSQSSLIIQNNVITSTLTNAASAQGSNRGLIILGNGIGANKPAVASILLQNNTVHLLDPAADESGRYFVIYTQAASPVVTLVGNKLNNAIPNGLCIGPRSIAGAPNSLCSHLPR